MREGRMPADGEGLRNSLEDKKKSEEAKAARKAELLFKAESRRNKLLGLWAAERMGHDDPAAYAAEIVAVVFVKPGIENVYNRLFVDLETAGKPVPLDEIAKKAQELFVIAQEQVDAEAAKSDS